MYNIKYYTPVAEEFHIGFEYEWTNKDSNNWIPAIADVEDCYHCVRDIQQNLNYREYRVKYLNKEDIMSFELIQRDSERCGGEFRLCFLIPDKCALTYFPDTNKLYIKDKTEQIFAGIVKNKSELKKLLIQLEIIKDAKI